MPNIQDPEFNKNVSMVYVEEPGFTGYRGLDFTKIDDIETMLRSVISGALISGLVVFPHDLSPLYDGVQAYPEKSTMISNSSPSGQNGLILDLNPVRRELYIQNLSTGKLYVKYGSGASPNSFNFILAANSDTNAGDGGSLSDQSYLGAVSVSGTTMFNSPRYISWERF